jgi:glycosyltransferase involved in cell wall biosynthesis
VNKGNESPTVALITGNYPPDSHDGSADYNLRLVDSISDPSVLQVAYIPIGKSFWSRLWQSPIRSAKILHFQALSWNLNKLQVFIPFLARLLNPRAKVITTLHEWDSLKPLLRVAMYPFPMLSSRLIFVSRSEMAAYEAHPIQKVFRRKTTWIPIGCNLDIPELTKSSVGEFREQQVMKGLDPETKIIVHFGWIYRTKRPELMLEMMSELKARGVKAKLIFAGDFHPHHPDRKVAFRESIESMGLSDVVEVLGFIEDDREAAMWIAASDAMIGLFLDGLSMRRGSFWFASQLGCPIITTELQSPEEFGGYSEGLTPPHILFVPKQVEAGQLADQVESLAPFEPLRFPPLMMPSWQAIGEEHETVYSELTNR